jgi:hypothetical protein
MRILSLLFGILQRMWVYGQAKTPHNGAHKVTTGCVSVRKHGACHGAYGDHQNEGDKFDRAEGAQPAARFWHLEG